MSLTRAALASALLLSCAAAAFPAAAEAPRYDLVFAGGRVVDGTGAPWFRADVGIVGDRVAAIGDLSRAPAGRRVDASGLVVCPGFIDMLGQSEYAVLVDPRAASKITQGITTEITGEGSAIAPLNARIVADGRATWERYGVTPDWTTLGGYWRAFERAAPGDQPRHLRRGRRRAQPRDRGGRPPGQRDGARGDAGGRRAGDGGRGARPVELAHLRARPLRLDRGDRRAREGRAALRRLLHHPPAQRGRHDRREPRRGLPRRARGRDPGRDLPPQGGGAAELGAHGGRPEAHRGGAGGGAGRHRRPVPLDGELERARREPAGLGPGGRAGEARGAALRPGHARARARRLPEAEPRLAGRRRLAHPDHDRARPEAEAARGQDASRRSRRSRARTRSTP